MSVDVWVSDGNVCTWMAAWNAGELQAGTCFSLESCQSEMRDRCRRIISDLCVVHHGREPVFMLFTKPTADCLVNYAVPAGRNTALGIFFHLQYDYPGNWHFSRLFRCRLWVTLYSKLFGDSNRTSFLMWNWRLMVTLKQAGMVLVNNSVCWLSSQLWLSVSTSKHVSAHRFVLVLLKTGLRPCFFFFFKPI